MSGYAIKDEKLVEDIRRLAGRKHMKMAEYLRELVAAEKAKEDNKPKVSDLLAPIHAKLAKIATVQPMTAKEQKKLSDEFWGE